MSGLKEKKKKKKLHGKMLLKEIRRVVEHIQKNVVISSPFNLHEVEELFLAFHFYHMLLFR